MYLNNFIDRAALGQARLSTLEEDLGMSGTDFNLAISILFVGYLTMQLPSNLLITRVRPCKYCASNPGRLDSRSDEPDRLRALERLSDKTDTSP
jgi:hypothetical protein